MIVSNFFFSAAPCLNVTWILDYGLLWYIQAWSLTLTVQEKKKYLILPEKETVCTPVFFPVNCIIVNLIWSIYFIILFCCFSHLFLPFESLFQFQLLGLQPSSLEYCIKKQSWIFLLKHLCGEISLGKINNHPYSKYVYVQNTYTELVAVNVQCVMFLMTLSELGLKEALV